MSLELRCGFSSRFLERLYDPGNPNPAVESMVKPCWKAKHLLDNKPTLNSETPAHHAYEELRADAPEAPHVLGMYGFFASLRLRISLFRRFFGFGASGAWVWVVDCWWPCRVGRKFESGGGCAADRRSKQHLAKAMLM